MSIFVRVTDQNWLFSSVKLEKPRETCIEEESMLWIVLDRAAKELQSDKSKVSERSQNN
jgi:hypothetical protein